jgi:hypothetical protein
MIDKNDSLLNDLSNEVKKEIDKAVSPLCRYLHQMPDIGL